jgi:hypothetical protein
LNERWTIDKLGWQLEREKSTKLISCQEGSFLFSRASRGGEELGIRERIYDHGGKMLKAGC